MPDHPPEVVAARKEDPTFAETLGRARARILNVPYDPEKHHPMRPSGSVDHVPAEADARIAEILATWQARANRWNRTVEDRKHLRAI